VVVTDAQERCSVAAIRSLRAAGYEVAAIAAPFPAPAPAHWSRACAERIHLAHPRADPDGFAAGLAALVAGDRYAALLPAGDASLLAISRHRQRIEPHVRVGLPSHETVERALDKDGLAAEAARAELAAPATIQCRDYPEAAAAVGEFGLPVVIKPVRSVFRAGGATHQQSSRVVADFNSLAALVPDYGTPFLIQRREQGAVYSCAGVRTGDGLLGLALSRYLRTWPPEGGNVSCSESVEPIPELIARVEALLAEIGWEGIFELELIRRPNGSFATIDFNPRIYGSIALAGAAGAPLAALWCNWLLGREARPSTARAGVVYRWEDAELRNLWCELRRRSLRRAVAVARPRRSVVYAHLAASDPGPLAARVLFLARRALARSRAGKAAV
jgi:predicted ATP-grasp superfamily ATP-dependent carboligase